MYEGDVLSNRAHSKHLYPSRALNYSIPWHVPLATRAAWVKEPEALGQMLTEQVPNLSHVEVDNSIAPSDTCDGGTLKIVMFNAERGRYWLAAVPLLADADIIILNEMDIGMARSDQQHTTRLLAFMLGMNYAWGLEFMELTSGTRTEQQAFSAIPNFHGLHGSAFLTRCKISDPALFRDPVGSYFADSPSQLNAQGFEKRLGGRIGVFGRIQVGSQTVVVGSTHKLSHHSAAIRKYISPHKAVVAGDNGRGRCKLFGLENVDDKHAAT